MTEREIKRLLQRIKMRWRRTGTYTAVYEDGAEVPVMDPREIVADGLVGIYNEHAQLRDLRDDWAHLASERLGDTFNQEFERQFGIEKNGTG